MPGNSDVLSFPNPTTRRRPVGPTPSDTSFFRGAEVEALGRSHEHRHQQGQQQGRGSEAQHVQHEKHGRRREGASTNMLRARDAALAFGFWFCDETR